MFNDMFGLNLGVDVSNEVVAYNAGHPPELPASKP